MVVIDVGAHYLGYSSDICRSFFIDPPKQKLLLHGGFLASVRRLLRLEREQGGEWSPPDPKLHAEKLRVWDIVLEAQTAAAGAFRPNATAASIDIAARTVIEDAGYGYGFTHRLGHGIGIKGQQPCQFCSLSLSFSSLSVYPFLSHFIRRYTPADTRPNRSS